MERELLIANDNTKGVRKSQSLSACDDPALSERALYRLKSLLFVIIVIVFLLSALWRRIVTSSSGHRKQLLMRYDKVKVQLNMKSKK